MPRNSLRTLQMSEFLKPEGALAGGARSIEQILAEEGSYASLTDGVSMRPLFKTHRDMVVLRPVDRQIRKYDVVLYRVGEKYILHRVIGFKGDSLIIRGDNTFTREIVGRSAVIARLVSFNRKGKHGDVENLGYKLYSRLWTFIYPIRYCLYALKRILARIKRTIIRKKEK